MNPPHSFNYQDARNAFISRTSDAEHLSYIHPEAGPDGEIAMDVAFWKRQN